MLATLRIVLAALLFLQATAHPLYAQTETQTAELQSDYEVSFDRLERLKSVDEGRFAAARAQLIRELKSRIDEERTRANKSAELADQYRDLARSADAEYERRLKAAREFTELANDKDLSEDDQARLRKTATQAQSDADAARENARERRARAVEWRRRAESENDVVLALQALERRAREISFTPEPETRTAEPNTTETEEDRMQTALNPDEGANEDLEVQDVIGLWRPISGPEFPFVIVQERPGDDAFPNRLEVHTSNRVWKGNFSASPAGSIHRDQNARVVATYKPQAGEMNDALPDWVAAQIEGQLEWRLEVNEIGSIFAPRLKVRWFRGEVRWKEGAEEQAWIEGDGVPLIWEMEREALFDIVSSKAVTIWVEPVEQPNRFAQTEKNYESDRISEVIKHQPLKVKVRMPPELARDRGPSITIAIKASNGDSTTLDLIGPRVSQTTAASRGITYTHPGSVSIADFLSEPEKDPQFMSLGYLAQFWARESDKGTRLSLDVDNGNLVEFSYDGASHGVFIWNSHVKSGIALHQRLLGSQRMLAAAVLQSAKATNEEKESATLQLRLLQNFETLVSRDDLLPKHIYHLGELYLVNGLATTNATCMSEECSQYPSDVGLAKLTPADLSVLSGNFQTAKPSKDYFIEVVADIVGALTGAKNTPVGLRVANGVNWVDPSEKLLVAMTLNGVSDEIRSGVSKTVGDLAYAIPKAFVDDLSIVFTGRDWKGRQVSDADRGLTLSRIVFKVLLEKTGGLATNRILRLRQQTLAPIGNRKSSRLMLRAPTKLRAPVTTATAETAAPHAAVKQAVPDMPESVTPSQSKQLAVRFDDSIPEDGYIACEAEASSLEPEEFNLYDELVLDDTVGTEYADLVRDLNQQRRLKVLKSRIERKYSASEDIDITIEQEGVFLNQGDAGICVGVSTAKIIQDFTGEEIPLHRIVQEFAANDLKVNDAFIVRMEDRLTDLRARYSAAVRARSPEHEDLLRQVGLEQDRLKEMRKRRSAMANVKLPSDQLELVKKRGILLSHAAQAIKRRGGSVTMVDPASNPMIEVRHLQALKKKGYGVLVNMKQSKGTATHAVTLMRIDEVDGVPTRVHWFDPAHDVHLSASPQDFEKLMAKYPARRPIPSASGGTEFKLAQSVLMIVKF